MTFSKKTKELEMKVGRGWAADNLGGKKKLRSTKQRTDIQYNLK